MTTTIPPSLHSQSDLFSEPASAPKPSFPEASPDWVVSFDGAMEPAGHPGARGSWGFVVQDATDREIYRNSDLMAPGACKSNNVAEYTALLKAIDWAAANLPRDAAILFQGDSQVVVHNVRGVWGWNDKKTRRNPHKDAQHLRTMLDDVVGQLKGFRPIAKPFVSEPGPSPLANHLPIIWVRGQNNPADSVSREPFEIAGITYPKR